jgi:hypothetical protein
MGFRGADIRRHAMTPKRLGKGWLGRLGIEAHRGEAFVSDWG